jgi:dephospho-CoA kinase
MFLIGLTGGIASGKSTVSRLLAEHGADIIDADLVAREVIEPGTTGFNSVVAKFGSGIVEDNGRISRESLAQIVFADSKKRLELEGILHPLIRARTLELIQTSTSDVVVYAVPLLVEAKVDYPFDLVVTVESGIENQIERLESNRSYSREQAEARVEAQASSDERRARADIALENTGSIKELESQVSDLWRRVKQLSEEKASRG